MDFDTVDRYCDKLMKLYTGRRKPSSGHEHSKRGRRTGTQKKGKRMKEKKLKEKKLNGTIIITYRCNARCSMCNRYKAPSRPEEEISIETIRKLPRMYFTNITGGEPFIRTDLKDIVRELYKKSDRIVISTNGFFTDRIVNLCKDSLISVFGSLLKDWKRRMMRYAGWRTGSNVDTILFRFSAGWG